MIRLFVDNIERNRDSVAFDSRAIDGMRYVTLKHHHAACYRIERNLIYVEHGIIDRFKFVKLQRAAGIDKSESSCSRIRLDEVRATEH